MAKFKKGDKVILVRDYRACPKLSLMIRLTAGQVFKITEVPKPEDYPHSYESEAGDQFKWVRVNGINPETGKKYQHEMAIDLDALMPYTEIGGLLYGS